TELDDALRAEGVAREIVVRVNQLRKQSGLAIETRIELDCASDDALVQRAVDEHGELIGREVLANEVRMTTTMDLGTSATAFDLGDDRTLSVAIRAVP
ncbi:MAG TPA: DUF5915 domain-containing protein, partial [Planctomycetota bacterium]|nr:DUF5915 domain-containing protein [Planctomycetota bacterium]